MNKEEWFCVQHACDEDSCNCPDDCYTPCVVVEELEYGDWLQYVLLGRLLTGAMRLRIEDDGSGLDPA
jgi:hypothetical protein